MEVFGRAGGRQRRRTLGVLGLVVCMTTVVTGVVDVTIVSKYQFFDESAHTWLYCYYTGSLLKQNRYEFGIEVDTGEGTGFTGWRSSGSVTGGNSVRIWNDSINARVGAFSCLVRTPDSSQTEKAITFKIKSQADVWPVAFTVTTNTGDPVTLQMVQKSNRTGTLEWRKGGVGGTVLTGQNGLSLTIASVQSSDEGIYECYYQGDTDRRQGIMRLIVRGCAENKWGPSCTGDCPVCYNGGVCDDNTGECVCPPGFHGQNCESACTNGLIGTSCTRECDGGNCTGQLLCVMDPYGCSCAPGLMGIECNTVCPDGLYGAGCTQTCHCADGPAACDKKTGACTGGCMDFWTGNSCQMRTATVSYEGLFVKEEGRFFGDSSIHVSAYDNIDTDECARRCLQGYGSYDGVNPTCLSFNHRPAGSPEGGSARCWLRSSDKDTVASPGPEWDSWPYRNYYQRKQLLTPQDCTDVFKLGIQHSQVYTVGHPQPFQAYCDMDIDGGGWTIIQRRQDGSVPFDKTWTEYEQGFGNPSGEYWLGLENIHSLTTQKQNELYVYLEDWELNSRFARYSTFSVGNTSSKYTATIDGYSGDADDSLDSSNSNGRHNINNRQFSTIDQDNDGVSTDCAGTYGQGGWWYTPSCGYSMLNGQYLTGCSIPAPPSCSTANGIIWYTWRGYYYSLKKTVMMIRPADFPVSSFQPCENDGTLTSGPENSGLYICACADGWYGAFCDHACGHCYMGQPCNKFYGTCPTGRSHVCAAGYNGTKCDQECFGTYGPDCNTTCGHCYGSHTCDRFSGTCPTGGFQVCAAGYNGHNCDQVCSSGEFGPDCSGTCHCGSGGSVCDILTGVCSSGGCEVGWKGNTCQIQIEANQGPIFIADMDYLQIPEDTSIGATVYILNATDADGDTLTYGVSGQVAHNLFSVNPVSGAVSLRIPLDRELTDEYNITVTVSDGQNPEVRNRATIFITDANDNSPVFLGVPYQVDVHENDIQQTSIFRVTATDADQGIAGNVFYYLETGDETKFEVERQTGVVNLKEALNHEPTSVYQLHIRAQDGGGSYQGRIIYQNSTTLLTVNVINENATDISNHNVSSTVTKNNLSNNNNSSTVATTVLPNSSVATTVLSNNNISSSVATTVLSNNISSSVATTILSNNNISSSVATTVLSNNNMSSSVATTVLSNIKISPTVPVATIDLFKNNISSKGATLDLSNNNISFIPPDVFKNQSNIQHINLSSNKISYLNGSIFAHLVNLEVLDLSNNVIESIPVDVFINLSNLKLVDLSKNSITDLQDNTFVNNANLEILRLDGNNISAIRPDMFKGLRSLRQLFLNNSGLLILHSASFAPLRNVEELYLQDNNIRHLPVNTFQGLMSLAFVNLQGNYFGRCNCNVLKPQICMGSNVKSASFNFSISCGNETLNCNKLSVSENCQHDKGDGHMSVLIPVAIVIVVALLVLYRYRTYTQALIYTKCHWCPCWREDNTGKTYDAFISYSIEDQNLVVRELAPGLEERGFELCLDYRDFPAGACIATTIIESVETSRQTIILLSQNFVDSEWCALAFKAAHQQMLKDKQSRIVIIAISDETLQQVDKDLQFFLTTNERLKWGEPQFWRKLTYALSRGKKGKQNHVHYPMQGEDIEMTRLF